MSDYGERGSPSAKRGRKGRGAASGKGRGAQGVNNRLLLLLVCHRAYSNLKHFQRRRDSGRSRNRESDDDDDLDLELAFDSQPSFSLEVKLSSEKFTSCFVQEMLGKGIKLSLICDHVNKLHKCVLLFQTSQWHMSRRMDFPPLFCFGKRVDWT